MLHDILPADRRVAARYAVERAMSVATDTGVYPATTIDMSTSGMLIALVGELTIWSEVILHLPGVGPRSARVVRREGDRYGMVLREPLSGAEFAELAGITLPEPVSVPAIVPVKPAARIAPWAFGRDRLKTFKREAAERADVDRRG